MKNHYRKPMLFAGVLLIIALGMLFGGFWMESETSDMNYFGIAFIGLFLVIMALVTYFVFLNLQHKLDDLMRATPLMAFDLSDEEVRIAIEANNEALKRYNLRIWLTIVGFCALFALTGPLFAEEWGLLALICLAIAVFFTFVFLIATAVRTKRFKKADNHVILNEKGIYFMGQYATFTMTGNWLSVAEYDPEKALLTLTVSSATTAGPADSTMIIPIPENYRDKIETILGALPTQTL